MKTLEGKQMGKINQRSIGVISLNTQDFILWKINCILKPDGLDTERRFNVGDTTYYCVSNVCDLCSQSFDDIMETNLAKDNNEYEQIKLLITTNYS